MSEPVVVETRPEELGPPKKDARNKLFWVTLFLGELRDGLTMVSGLIDVAIHR